MRDLSAREIARNYLNDLTEYFPRNDYLLEKAFLELLLRLEEKEEEISDLTGKILGLSDNQVEASRDDHYFAKGLTGVFGAVEDWIDVTFEDAPAIGQQLGQEAEISFSNIAGDGWRELLEKDHVLLFTSMVTRDLVHSILEPHLLGMDHPYLKLIIPAIQESFLKGMDGGRGFLLLHNYNGL